MGNQETHKGGRKPEGGEREGGGFIKECLIRCLLGGGAHSPSAGARLRALIPAMPIHDPAVRVRVRGRDDDARPDEHGKAAVGGRRAVTMTRRRDCRYDCHRDLFILKCVYVCMESNAQCAMHGGSSRSSRHRDETRGPSAWALFAVVECPRLRSEGARVCPE